MISLTKYGPIEADNRWYFQISVMKIHLVDGQHHCRSEFDHTFSEHQIFLIKNSYLFFVLLVSSLLLVVEADMIESVWQQ